MRLKDSKYLCDLDYPMLLELAKNSRGEDDEGYRAEFIRLVEMSQLLQRRDRLADVSINLIHPPGDLCGLEQKGKSKEPLQSC